ncbi:DNA helicase [Trifolium repens]|nr:hypothetical protein QL285_067594 [Trifolium repens]KAK2419570.1 hypothetical protein QL285_030415 [Trifolium repens]KAK2435324.1 hypothetical protein QL285_020394 [Trifolium repens]WJX73176.1 DNA helicase [Trifolium repens]
MAARLRELLLQPPKGYFSTVHVRGQVEGEVEPSFYEEFRNELGRIWRLFDTKGLQIMVEFNDDDELPRIRNGWMTLRKHYKFGRHHQIFFKYLGNNNFEIIPSEKEITPSNFPTWHTQTRALRKSVTFKITMEEDPEVSPYLTLPSEMGEYLWKTMLDQIFLVGTIGEKHMCNLKYERDPFVVKIEMGWKECVGINGFKVGDRLQFTVFNIYDDHTIMVTKLN